MFDVIALIDMFIYTSLYDFYAIDDIRNLAINTDIIEDIQYADTTNTTNKTQKLVIKEILSHAFIFI